MLDGIDRVIRRARGVRGRDVVSTDFPGAPVPRGPLLLPVAASSAAAARRHVREVLADVPDEVVADAEVCVSELVTNAVLHAGTEVGVDVARRGGWVRVTVSDGSSDLPRWVPRTLGAATGRGLALIHALSSAHGARVHADGRGKDVWCELAVHAPRPPLDPPAPGAGGGDTGGAGEFDGIADVDPALAAQWAEVVEELTEPAPADDGSTLWLLGYPVRLGVRMREHREAVLRELQVLLLGGRFGRVDVAAVADGVRAMLDALYGRLSPAEVRNLQALVSGLEHVDLPQPRLPGQLELIERWQRCVRDLDELGRAPERSSLATPADVEALERWIVAELSRQLHGAPPRPWPGP